MTIKLESHRNENGRCALDGEDWPCSAVPATVPGYETAQLYARAQRAGDAWNDELPTGLQAYGSSPTN